MHELDALQKILQVRATAHASVVDGALQIIDRREQILEEILGAEAERLLPLALGAAAVVLEIRVQADQTVLGLDELGREILDAVGWRRPTRGSRRAACGQPGREWRPRPRAAPPASSGLGASVPPDASSPAAAQASTGSGGGSFGRSFLPGLPGRFVMRRAFP